MKMQDKTQKQITLDHGSGGSASSELIESLFLEYLTDPVLKRMEDAAVLCVHGKKLAFSTDSFVVDPIFFPGGSIGELAINGTINDLAMQGARPAALSLGLIIEEGFGLDDLERIIRDIADTCRKAEVPVVTGDTKVVPRGKADRIFINTSGIGIVDESIDISSSRIREGDAVLLSGSIADHGVTILTSREGLEFQGELQSDTCALHKMVQAILGNLSQSNNVHALHALRDPTRGGLATTLSELARSSGTCMEIFEAEIPIAAPVRAACELMGLDPLYIANEGKFIAIAEEQHAESIIEVMRSFPEGHNGSIIGKVTSNYPGKVVVHTSSGGSRLAEPLTGEPLPRIC